MRALLLALLAVCCLSARLVEAVGNEVPERSICLSLTAQQLPVNRIKTYIIQEGSMKAVILITKRGMKVCADPHTDWVRTAIKTVDSRSNTRRSTVKTSPPVTRQSTSAAVNVAG